MAGAAAETATPPDSAPHTPLKTEEVSPVTRMRPMAASGVPTISTPLHQFIGAAIGIHAPYHDGKNLKGLRRGALCQGKSALNVLEIKSVRLALLLYLIQQLLPKFGVLHRVGRAYDQVPLTSHGHEAGLGTAMPVGVIKARDRHARHQEVAQDPILDHLDLCSRYAFVVVLVPACQPDAVQSASAWDHR